MGKIDLTFTDNDPGFKHIQGHAHLDTKANTVTFTDATDRHITGMGYLTGSSSGSSSDGATGGTDAGGLICAGLGLLYLLGVILIWPILLTTDMSGMQAELIILLFIAAISVGISGCFGFTVGEVCFIVLLLLSDIIFFHVDITIGKILLYLIFGSMLGAVPCGIGHLIFVKCWNKNQVIKK